MDKKIIGVTGGIGSGKSTVVKLFEDFGIPIFNADDEAKKIMNKDLHLKKEIICLLGDNAYHNNQLNRSYVATKVFSDEGLLQRLNAIVHPALHIQFHHWSAEQYTKSVMYEAAILIEQGRHTICDLVILVTAPREERILRVMNRDGISREEVEIRMSRQMSDDKKKNFANFVIENTNLHKTKENIQNIYKYLKDNNFI